LDAGAGKLQYKEFCNHLEYVSQDFRKYDGKGDGCGYQTVGWNQSKLHIVCDITNIPEPDDSFDAIMCIEVLEHLPDPIAALREFSRLLKVGGVLILTAPFCSLTHMSPYHFYTGYNRYFYERWLPEFGFEIKEIDYNGNFFEYLAQEMRRVDEMAKKYCNGATLSRKERLGKQIVLGMLNVLSASDQGSKEFLSFGLHIRAIKL
jgi:ubiquinone/menaquinone biosynthesis C-methylase UbiE